MRMLTTDDLLVGLIIGMMIAFLCVLWWIASLVLY